MIIEILYIIICVVFAALNSELINQGKKVNHFLQGAVHITVAVLCGKFVSWAYIPLILFTARIWFTTALNYYRQLPFFYVNPDPASFTDKLEQKIFKKNGELAFFVYLTGWIISNVLLFVL